MRNLFSSLLLALSLVAGFAQALAAEPVAGTNYEVLNVAQPTSAPPGKVEVIEFFWYASSQCYKLEPTIEAFVKKEGDRILFKRVPVNFQERFELWSKFYYSLVQFGLEEKLMLAVYNEIQKKNGLVNMAAQATFLATQGVDREKFLEAYYSRSMIDQLRQATKLFEDYHIDYHIDALPTLVVAGRYKITPVNNGVDGMATVLDYVVKQVQDKKL
jgi:protein dithiol oxidoreductase (disulfide-forming)